MEYDFERVIADLRRRREELASLFDNVAHTKEERAALLRSVDRIRQEAGPHEAPGDAGERAG